MRFIDDALQHCAFRCQSAAYRFVSEPCTEKQFETGR